MVLKNKKHAFLYSALISSTLPRTPTTGQILKLDFTVKRVQQELRKVGQEFKGTARVLHFHVKNCCKIQIEWDG